MSISKAGQYISPLAQHKLPGNNVTDEGRAGMVDSDEMQRQLEELQSQLAFQEDTVAALNAALSGQQQEILTLKRQLALLKQRLDEQALHVDAEGPAASEKPPHY